MQKATIKENTPDGRVYEITDIVMHPEIKRDKTIIYIIKATRAGFPGYFTIYYSDNFAAAQKRFIEIQTRLLQTQTQYIEMRLAEKNGIKK